MPRDPALMVKWIFCAVGSCADRASTGPDNSDRTFPESRICFEWWRP